MATATVSPASTLYYVKSAQNRPGAVPLYYLVTEQSGRPMSCECKAAAFGRRCWHRDVVSAGMVSAARPKRAVTPALWSGDDLCERPDQHPVSAYVLCPRCDRRYCEGDARRVCSSTAHTFCEPPRQRRRTPDRSLYA